MKHAPRYDRAFEAESLAVSPSGRHACVSGRFDEGSGARPTAACYVAYLSAGASDGTVPARAGSSGNSGEESDSVEACECETVSVCEEEFDAAASGGAGRLRVASERGRHVGHVDHGWGVSVDQL